MLLEIMTGKNTRSASMQGWLYNGGQATVASYRSGKIPQADIDWFESLPTYLDLGDFWLTHAGVDPHKTVSEQTLNELCWIRGEFHSMTQPYFPDKTIVAGHTITFTLPGVIPGNLAQGQGWIDIDTGAYHPRSGWLTGLDITNHLVYQANVFSHAVRILPWEEVITIIKPKELIGSRRHR
jgi:serine/threonine protein phosphatase 1